MFTEILTAYGKARELRSCAFDFRVRRKGLSEAQFGEQLDKAAVALAGDSRYRTTILERVDNVSTRTPSRCAPAGSEFDAIVETWVTDFESSGLGELVRAAYEPFVDADRSTTILSIEYVAVDSDHTGNED
ncbi:hypothetical protein ACWEO2_40685 [Nocardia sp. NPDC004278]